MRDSEHPSSALLLRFLRGESSQDEGRIIILHLLTGCAQCCARTRPVWIEMERLARRWAETRPQPAATGPPAAWSALQENLKATDWIEIDEARSQLRADAAGLREIQGRLATLLARVRPSPQETSDEDLGVHLDVPTEIRSVLAYALQEHLEPLIGNLLAAAEYQPTGTADGTTLPREAPQGDRLDRLGS